jgi:hypothetical protein
VAETEAGTDININWYWAQDGRQNGPAAQSAIVQLLTDGRLRADNMVWKQGMPAWVPVKQVPDLSKYLKITAAPPPVPAHLVIAAQAAPFGSTVLGYQNAPIDQSSLHQFVHDPSARVTCPHCSAINCASLQFCEPCGMALPQPNFGPRIVDDSSFASTTAGQILQSEDLHKQAKRAASALLTVAIIQTVSTGLGILITSSNRRALPVAQNPILLGMAVIAVVFWGLYIWSRFQPLPAAIVGLVLYVTMKVIELVLAIVTGTIGRPSGSNGLGNGFGGGYGGTGISWITIVVIVVLSQAISAGLKYRKLQNATTANVVI